jgi:hypothetical protein
VIVELPGDYPHWDKVYHCIELCFMKRHDVRNSLIVSFVSLLLHLSCHIPSPQQSTTALTLAHCILLRYPRTREQMAFLQQTQRALPQYKSESGTVTGLGSSDGGSFVPSYLRPQLDDVVGDLAMSALRKESKQNGVNSGLQPGLGDEADWGDGSWMSPLLSHHISQHYQQILKPLTSRSIIPVPLRIHEISADKEQSYLANEMERVFRQLPPTKRVIAAPVRPNGAAAKGGAKANGSNPKKGKGTPKPNKNQNQKSKQRQRQSKA